VNIAIYSRPRSLNMVGKALMRAFKRGLHKHDVKFTDIHVIRPKSGYDFAVSMSGKNSEKLYDVQRSIGRPFMTVKLGMFSKAQGLVDYHQREAASWNNINSLYAHCDLLDSTFQQAAYIRGQDNTRLRQCPGLNRIKLTPWKTSEKGYVLLIEQVIPRGYGHDIEPNPLAWQAWAQRQVLKIKDRMQRDGLEVPVKIRLHPRRTLDRMWKPKVPFLPNVGRLSPWSSLEECLDGAVKVVTLSSQSAIDAVIHGVPIYVADKSSLAKQVSEPHYSLQPLTRPDRQQWLRDIAYVYWSLNELRTGKYWDYVKQVILPSWEI